MKPRIKLVSLTLVGTRKNYVVKFKDGLNYISGHTSTGKTSILEMIDYALGAKNHKSYIEIGSSCTQVELEFLIGTEKLRITRQLFDFKASVIVESWNEKEAKYLFFNRFEIDVPSNSRSLSAFLIEKMGLSSMTISGQCFSFRDLYKYCYIKQTEIDNEDILDEKSWERNFKRKATFEIIFNVYDKALENLKSSLEKKRDELKELELKLAGIEDFLKSVNITDLKECTEKRMKLQQEIIALQQQLSAIKKDQLVVPAASMKLRSVIEQTKTSLERTTEEKNNQEQYLNKLRLLFNQYLSEIERKELAISGYIAFNRYEFAFCPNCLKPLSNSNGVETCCLCGSEKSDDKSEIVLLKKDISTLKRKSNELLRFIDEEDKTYDRLLRDVADLKNKLYEEELELQHLSKDYVNPNLQQIEYINYEIGKKSRLVFELHNTLRMFEEVQRYQKLVRSKETAIQKLKDTIKTITQNAIAKKELMEQLTKTFGKVLSEFEFPKLSMAYIDEKNYLPYVRGRKYDDIGSLAAVTMMTIAYYFSIMVVGSSDEFHHPNLLIIDSPRKNLGAQAAKSEDKEFKDEKIFNAMIKYLLTTVNAMEDNVQLIIVNNGYPDFLPKDCIVAEFDADGRSDLPRGLIDDAPEQ